MRKPEIRERILEFIRRSFDERGYAPTVRDIVKGCNLSSTSVAQHHLNTMEKEGRIHRDPQVVRSIQLMQKDVVEVPLLGAIAAGKPIPVPGSDTWTTPPEEMLKLTADMVGNRRNVYALKIKGTSMVDALIDDGDTVVMEAVPTAENGQMVAVWLKDEQEVTLKKLYREAGRVRLQPANKQMKSIYVKPQNIEGQGKVVAVLRKVSR